MLPNRTAKSTVHSAISGAQFMDCCRFCNVVSRCISAESFEAVWVDKIVVRTSVARPKNTPKTCVIQRLRAVIVSHAVRRVTTYSRMIIMFLTERHVVKNGSTGDDSIELRAIAYCRG